MLHENDYEKQYQMRYNGKFESRNETGLQLRDIVTLWDSRNYEKLSWNCEILWNIMSYGNNVTVMRNNITDLFLACFAFGQGRGMIVLPW